MSFADPAAEPTASGAEETAAIYRRAGIVTFFTALSRVLGMARDLVIAHRFGASGATDAWVQAFRIPNALRRLTAEGSMTIAFVPVYVDVREREGAAAAGRFAQRVLGVVIAVTGLLTLLGMGFSDPLTLMFSPGFTSDPDKFALTSELIRWSFPYLLLVSLVAWAMGVLNSEHRYAAPAAAPIFLNLGIIAAVLAMTGAFEQPILAVSAGVLIGGVAQVILQVPSLSRAGAPLTPRFDWRDPHVARLMRLLGPSLLSVAVYELNIIVLGVIASYLPSGQIFHYNNATRLTELAMGLFTFAFATAGLPSLSEHVARTDWRSVSATVRLTFSAVLFTTLPSMAGLASAAPAIVSMLYLHGAYGQADVESTAAVLQLMALGMPAVAAVRIMIPIYYALNDSRTPALLSLLGLGVTGLLGWELSRIWEVRGLALGLTAGSWAYCLAMALRLRGRESALAGWFPRASLARQCLSASAVALFAAWVTSAGDWARGPHSVWNWIVFVAAVAGAVAVYAGANFALGEPEVRNWIVLLRRVGPAIRRRLLGR
jgi:putative peptidoglycan lipid II flippase